MQEYWSGQPIPSPAVPPDPGIEPGSPALYVDSLPTEVSGKPLCRSLKTKQNKNKPNNTKLDTNNNEYQYQTMRSIKLSHLKAALRHPSG